MSRVLFLPGISSSTFIDRNFIISNILFIFSFSKNKKKLNSLSISSYQFEVKRDVVILRLLFEIIDTDASMNVVN